MNRSFSSSSKRPVIRQPSAVRQYVPKKVSFGLQTTVDAATLEKVSEQPVKQSREKTPAEILNEKMALMAADPNAVTVYWTENGPDAEGWDIIFPEYKILTEAFEGGYGWYDLTEGRGQHLLPKPKPYKNVNITAAELKAIRAQKADAGEKVAEMDERRAFESLCEKTEREAMEKEDRAAEQYELSEKEKIRAEQEKLERRATAEKTIMADIYALQSQKRVEDFLVEFVIERLLHYDNEDRDEIMKRVCTRVDTEKLLFVTPPSRPDYTPQPLPPCDTVPYIHLTPPVSLSYFLDVINFFAQNQRFVRAGYMYTPYAHSDGRKLFVPEIYLQRTLFPSTILYAPLPPVLPAVQGKRTVPSIQNFLAQPRIYFANEVFVPSITYDGQHIYLPERNIIDCVSKNLAQARPPPQRPAPAPLPVIKAVIVNRPPPIIGNLQNPLTARLPPIIKIRKVHMPRHKRILEILAGR